MPDGSATLTLTLHQTIADVPAAEWDACAGAGNPFVRQAFLGAGGCGGSARRAGRFCRAGGAARQDGWSRWRRCASHSYGEYVFDHGWAHAPGAPAALLRLQVAAPFQPIRGRGCCGIRTPVCRSARWHRRWSGVPFTRSVVGARGVLLSGMAGTRRDQLAQRVWHAVPLGECRLRDLRRLPGRVVIAQPRCCGASGATRTRAA
jgi:hypothetical protein